LEETCVISLKKEYGIIVHRLLFCNRTKKVQLESKYSKRNLQKKYY